MNSTQSCQAYLFRLLFLRDGIARLKRQNKAKLTDFLLYSKSFDLNIPRPAALGSVFLAYVKIHTEEDLYVRI